MQQHQQPHHSVNQSGKNLDFSSPLIGDFFSQFSCKKRSSTSFGGVKLKATLHKRLLLLRLMMPVSWSWSCCCCSWMLIFPSFNSSVCCQVAEEWEVVLLAAVFSISSQAAVRQANLGVCAAQQHKRSRRRGLGNTERSWKEKSADRHQQQQQQQQRHNALLIAHIHSVFSSKT